MTPFQRHVAQWTDCTRCPLHEGRRHVCLIRAQQVPCDVLFIGEAPGLCITGDTVIDTAYRDKTRYPRGIPIKSLIGKSGFYVYSFNKRKMVLGKVTKVWRTGVKPVYRVRFYWWGPQPHGKGGRRKCWGHINVTGNHQLLLGSGEYKSIDNGLIPGDRLQPFYRHTMQKGTRWKIGLHSCHTRIEAPYLLEQKLGRKLRDGEQCHHKNKNPADDSYDNLELMDIAAHARLHGLEDNVMFSDVHRQAHKTAMASESYRRDMSRKLKRHLADPANYRKRCRQIQKQRGRTSETVRRKFATDPVYYYNYLKGKRFRNGAGYSPKQLCSKFAARFPNIDFPPTDGNHVIYSIKPIGRVPVYDMSVENLNNFVANGIFVHNSEDALGEPFVGAAGHLFDGILERALRGSDVTYGFTNLIGCIPKAEGGGKNAAPPKESILACQPRLREIIGICRPKLIVCVGAIAWHWLLKAPVQLNVTGTKSITVTHPAAILRSTLAMRPLAIRRCEIAIAQAVGSL